MSSLDPELPDTSVVPKGRNEAAADRRKFGKLPVTNDRCRKI